MRSRIRRTGMLTVSGVILALAVTGCGNNGSDAGATDSGSPVRYSYRAIGGISMGGYAAAAIGLSNPDRFDVVMSLGTLMDTTTSLLRVAEQLRAGFCEPPSVGTSCPPGDGSAYFEDLGPASFEFDRHQILYVYHDSVLAFGNWMWNTPAGSTFLPPGVPASVLTMTDMDRCANPVVLDNFYDARWNPEGLFDVISFCDGPPVVGTKGMFDPAGVHDRPIGYLLAVDLDGDGLRGEGEPVLLQGTEPFQDVGTDGVPSNMEPGYDAVSNPDPAGDDWDAFDNATGTEGNRRYEEGEPYDDVGYDGVSGTAATNPYDAGEGNGVFDRTPNRDTLAARDPAELLAAGPLNGMAMWIDVGIRDEFGFFSDTLSFVGKAEAAGYPFERYDNFESIPHDGTAAWDIRDARFADLGPRTLVVYGDPDATPTQIAAGDGGHVDTPRVLTRLAASLAYAGSRWPLDVAPIAGNGRDEITTFFSDALGVDRDVIVHLPPGYDDEPDRGYPVIFYLHGFGMEPMDFIALSLFADALVNAGSMPPFVLVLPSGHCEGVECDEGSFYVDHPGFDGNGARFGAMLTEDLTAWVDANYRTLPPSGP